MGVAEFVEDVLLDFGLSDEPGDGLRIGDIEGLITIWPMFEQRRHEAGFMEGFRVSEGCFHEL